MDRARANTVGQGSLWHRLTGDRRHYIQPEFQLGVATLSDVILEASGLVYNYDREVCALRGLDFTARRGRKLAVLGANGAGKSTLFLHLNGTLRPEMGAIRINGQLTGYRRGELLEWRRR